MKELYARVTLDPRPSPEDKRLEYRKKRYERLMVLRGIRPASIKRYLARGFKGPFARVMHNEMQRLIWDMSYRLHRKHRRVA